MSETRDHDGARRLTGTHVLVVFLAFFGTIIGVNLFMAFKAVGTFPGLEANNGFAESQEFEARRTAQEALGWQVGATLQDGVLAIAFTGADGRPADVAGMQAVVGRATHVEDDVRPAFTRKGSVFRAPVTLEPGNWNIRLQAEAADGTPFVQRVVLPVD